MGGNGAGRRRCWQAAAAATGLAIGVGLTVVVRDSTTPAAGGAGGHPPSVTRFEFTAGPLPAVTAPVPAATDQAPAEEPATAQGALALFLQAMVDGRLGVAYAVLDEPGRRRFPTEPAWQRFWADTPRPAGFEVGPARAAFGGDGDVLEIEVTSAHVPSLDATRGLVPGRALALWQVRREGDRWRVAAEPVTVRPLLPPETSASAVVDEWVARLRACDRQGAAAMQAGAYLYGPAAFVQAPCEQQGGWRVGVPTPFDAATDQRDLVAAFGPGVGAWARLVPVEGPRARFSAVVAPLGEDWQVVGVTAAG